MIFSQVRSLAYVNYHLHRMLSLPLALYIIDCLESAIIVSCVTVFFHTELPITQGLLYGLTPLGGLLLLTYLINMNRHIVQTFERICKNLTDVQNGENVLERKHLCRISSHELALFKTYFEMRLFDMAIVNLKFILSSGLFALHLIVFLIQTN